MHTMFFSVKRVHLRVVEISKRLVKRFELTPARFDLLRIVDEHHPHPVAQAKIRALLGVSAATVSRMLISLEKLGFVERTESKVDARNLLVALTPYGWNQVDQAMVALITLKGMPERMARRGVAFEPERAVVRLRALQKHLNSMRRIYGDDAPFVHPWRADDLQPYHYTVVIRGRVQYTADFAVRQRYEEDDRKRSRKRSYAAAS
ncbi:MAG: MarR family [Myxococcaceae bacterium]|nr:MarR family [Myxococcaceae bacterium]MEA2752559.1 MarR family [Myxococcales bacterium]